MLMQDSIISKKAVKALLPAKAGILHKKVVILKRMM